jgi:hypothetical protein
LPVGGRSGADVGCHWPVFAIPLGSWNTLVDGLPVGMKACLELSFLVPRCDVAPLLATANGMEPLRTPRWMDCVQVVMFRQ